MGQNWGRKGKAEKEHMIRGRRGLRKLRQRVNCSLRSPPAPEHSTAQHPS